MSKIFASASQQQGSTNLTKVFLLCWKMCFMFWNIMSLSNYVSGLSVEAKEKYLNFWHYIIVLNKSRAMLRCQINRLNKRDPKEPYTKTKTCIAPKIRKIIKPDLNFQTLLHIKTYKNKIVFHCRIKTSMKATTPFSCLRNWK